MFTYIDPKFAAVVREERRKFYRRELQGVHPVSLHCLKWLLAYAALKTIWLPKGMYLLWLLNAQPREVQEKIISYLPVTEGCLAHALDLYNTERYVDHVKGRGSLTLVAVQYRFGFIVVL